VREGLKRKYFFEVRKKDCSVKPGPCAAWDTP
jgi:hypothetical protein